MQRVSILSPRRGRAVLTWSRRPSDKPLGMIVKFESPKRPLESSCIVVSSMVGVDVAWVQWAQSASGVVNVRLTAGGARPRKARRDTLPVICPTICLFTVNSTA